MFSRTLTTLTLALAVTFGSQIFMPADASAKPGSILVKSRDSGKRTHKGKPSSSSSKKSSRSSSSSSNRRTTTRSAPAQRTTTTRTTPTRRTTTTRTTPTRTTTTRTTPSRTTTTRTVRNVRPRTHARSTRTVHRSRPNVRRSYYSSSHSHHHSSHHTSHTTQSRSSTQTGRTHGRATTEPYITGGLGISGFASKQIVDGALPGIGYNLAIGAKGKLFGAELGVNGGGYTFDPGAASTDLALVGLSGDLKLQPSISFFEPYAALGIGGYALYDGIVSEASSGIGVRLGAGADFRFDNIAVRLSYQFGAYGLGNDSDAYGGGDIGARTETVSAGLLVYF